MKKLSLLLSTVFAVLLLVACGSPAEQPRSETADPLIDDAVMLVNTDSITVYIEDLVAFHTRHTLSTQTSPDQGIGAAVAYVVQRCEEFARRAEGVRPVPVVEVLYYPAGQKGGRYDRTLTVPEVLVTTPGTKAEREILLSAHIDTRVANVMDSTAFAPGANDDGSGVACLLEVVRILSEIPLEQTVKCAFVSGEEQGLDGSTFLAAKAKAENWPLMAMLNNDMIGNSEASGTGLVEDHKVRLFSDSRTGVDSDPRQLARYIKETARLFVPSQEVKLIYRNDRYRRSGDHTPFLREGFTAVRMSEYCENYDRTHQDVRTENGIAYGDLITGVDIPYLARNIQINLASVMNLAQAPARPQKARIANAGELENHTVIAWDPVRRADGSIDTQVSYQILCRETDQPEWNILDSVAADPSLLSPSFRCPLSKDNYFFAVRSVSPAGNPSLPALAL
jgi:hypothetical protein